MTIRMKGAGMVSPLGQGVAANWAAVLGGEAGIRPITRFHGQDFPQPEGGELPPELVDHFDEADGGPVSAMIVAAAREALGSAEWGADDELGLILGTNFGPMDQFEWAWRERIETGTMDVDTFVQGQNVVARVADLLGARGPRAQLTLSCASGAAVVATGCRWLQTGRAKRVLCVAYDLLTEFCWAGLTNLRTITTDRLRPFDAARQGTIFGEAAVAVLLTAEPQEGGVVVGGTALNNNAFHMTAPAKRGDGSRRVMAAALADAGISPAAVDWVCAHATGTTANDLTESQAIADLLGSPRPTMAFKGNLGHLLGAAGLAEVVLAACALEAGIVPGVEGLQQLDSELSVDVALQNRSLPGECLVTNSAGIGGNNAAVCLQRTPGPEVPAAAAIGVSLVRVGWVLPGPLVGSGERFPAGTVEALVANSATLAGFSAKPYLSSVRGYLDPVAAYALAALAQCVKEENDGESGIVAATGYGALNTGYTFYQQLVQKGPRLASPLLFPHAYASAAANLAAIEIGAAGPHCVFWTGLALQEAFRCAEFALREGKAKRMYVLAYDAQCEAAVPDGWSILPGACCWCLEADADGTWQAPEIAVASPLGVIADAISWENPRMD